MRRLINHPKASIIAILLVAALVRTIGISTRPIWYDEAFSILFAEKGPAAMLQGTLASAGTGAAEEHPLGYYLLLWSWMRLFGQSLSSARMLSILAGTCATGLAWLLGREMFSEKVGLLAGLFVALAPFQVHYGQEIRMYVFLCLWLLLATYAYLRGSRTGARGWWVLFGLSAALAQYTHTMAALYLLPLATTPLLKRDWVTLRSVLWSGLGALVLYLPWLVQLPSQMAKVDQSYWLERPGAEKIFTLLLVYITNLPLPNGWLLPGLFIALMTTAIALWETIRILCSKSPEAWNGFWLLYLAFVPTLLAFLLSFWRPLFLERTFIASGGVFCVWLAWSLFSSNLPGTVRGTMMALLAAGAAVGIYQHFTYAGFPYAPYRQMETSFEGDLRPGDVIIHSSKLSLLPSVYFDPKLEQEFIADPPGTSTDTLAPATQRVLGVATRPDIQSAAQDAARVRLVIFQQSIDEYTNAGQPTHPHIAWLDEHYRLVRVESWGDLRAYLYEQ